MIDLTKTYEQSGLFLSPDELPDHLCVVLEFASTQPPEVAKSFLGEMAHILNAIFSALLKRESPYAVVLAAVLELAGHKAQAVQIVADEPLDKSWSEPEAFDGCSTRGQARPGEAQPIHIVRKTSTQTRGVAA
jgi:nitrate reductase delta subunit